MTFSALDYLVSEKSNITIVGRVLSEGVTAVPAAEFLCKCRFAPYVGQWGGVQGILQNNEQLQAVVFPSPVNCRCLSLFTCIMERREDDNQCSTCFNQTMNSGCQQ